MVHMRLAVAYGTGDVIESSRQLARERTTPMSSYREIASNIMARIDAGDWTAGQQLPTDEQIAAEYGVSVRTAHNAMRSLVDRELIRSVRGHGRYVLGEPNDAEPAIGNGNAE